MSGVTILTDTEFESEVLQSSQLVLVYFWASWCGPCRLMAPLVEGIARTYGDRLKVVKMEVDPNPNSVAKCKVEGVPALRLFRAGEVLESSEGAINRQRIEAILEPHLVNHA